MPCASSFTLRVLSVADPEPASISVSDVVTTELPIGNTKRVFYEATFVYLAGSPKAHFFSVAWTVNPTGPAPTSTILPVTPQAGIGLQNGRVTGEVTTAQTRTYTCQLTIHQV